MYCYIRRRKNTNKWVDLQQNQQDCEMVFTLK